MKRNERKWKKTKENQSFNITDKLSGFNKKVILRWRLANISWQKKDNLFESKFASLKLESNNHIEKIHLTSGYTSKEYLKKIKIPVLEIEVNQQPAIIKTEINLLSSNF